MKKQITGDLVFLNETSNYAQMQTFHCKFCTQTISLAPSLHFDVPLYQVNGLEISIIHLIN